MKPHKKLLFLVLVCPFLKEAYADISYQSYDEKGPKAYLPHFVLGLSGGIGSTSLKQNAITDLKRDSVDYDFNPISGSKTKPVIGLFIGGEMSLGLSWLWQFGLQYQLPNSSSVKGDLKYNVAGDELTTYGYHLTTSQLLLQTKFLYKVGERFEPYALLGVGPAFNRFSHFEAPTKEVLNEPPFFPDASSTSLSYAVGLGSEIEVIKNHLRIGFSYRFSDLGSVKSGAESGGDPSFGTLGQKHLPTHQFLVELTGLI